MLVHVSVAATGRIFFWAERGGRSLMVVRPGRKEKRELGFGGGKNETWITNRFLVSFLSPDDTVHDAAIPTLSGCQIPESH